MFVIDTNVIFSALYNSDGPPGRILRSAAIGRIALFAPETVRDELARVLTRVLDYSPTECERAIQRLPVEWVEGPVYAGRLSVALERLRDQEDAPVLALGMALRCDVISGDADLQAVAVPGIQVWRPADLVGRV